MIVIMPGGFHPFHAGHYALYQSALKAFPGAEVYVAATNDMSERPFPFALKEKLAKLAGVKPGHFVQVKSPFKAEEITKNYDPEKDILIFVRSEKDKDESPKPGGIKKDGTPAYFQPWTGKDAQPFAKHAYFAYLPTVEFGPGITSATQIRKAWPTLNDRRKTALVMSLYPGAQKNPKLAQNVVGMFDQVMGGQVSEGVAENKENKCPPATQDITLNLKNRQKAIDEYGYGPLNPDLPNTKFWMKKVDEWNLDSVEEAKQSLCGNCAAFDIRQDTLDCIAKGIDSDNPSDAEVTIDAGELGYCKFLKFKCASRRTCDAWVTGGPLIDKKDVTESTDKKEATRRIQKMLNDKFGANLDIDGILGPLTLQSINKFMPNAKVGPADEPNKTTAVQGKKYKDVSEDKSDAIARTVKDLTNPPKVMQHRSKRDMEREKELQYRNISKRTNEGFGPGYPETYEQENKPFKHKGGYRITDITSEDVNEEHVYRGNAPGEAVRTAKPKRMPSQVELNRKKGILPESIDYIDEI
jgi:hypothetical protein